MLLGCPSDLWRVLREGLASMDHIATHLLDELLGTVVAPLAAQPARELDTKALTVEILVAVKEVHLQETDATAEGRLRAQLDDRVGALRGRQDGLTTPGGPRRIDAVRRQADGASELARV